MHVDMELTKMIIIMFELAWLWVPCQDIGLGWPISVLQVDVNRFWGGPLSVFGICLLLGLFLNQHGWLHVQIAKMGPPPHHDKEQAITMQIL